MYVRVCMRCLRVSEFIFVFECMFVCQYAHLHVQQCICMNVLYVNIKYSSTRISTHCATQRPPLTSISRMFRLSGPYRTSLSVLASFPPPPYPLILRRSPPLMSFGLSRRLSRRPFRRATARHKSWFLRHLKSRALRPPSLSSLSGTPASLTAL